MSFYKLSKMTLCVLAILQAMLFSHVITENDANKSKKFNRKQHLERKINLEQNAKNMPIREFNGFEQNSVCHMLDNGAEFTLKNFTLVTPTDPKFDLFWSIFSLEFNASGNLVIKFKTVAGAQPNPDDRNLEITQVSEITDILKQNVKMAIPAESYSLEQPAGDGNADKCKMTISDALGSSPIFNPEHLPDDIDPRWFFCHQYILIILIESKGTGSTEYTVSVDVTTYDVCPEGAEPVTAEVLTACLEGPSYVPPAP